MKISSANQTEAIKKARPNLKENSIKQYELHLRKLKKLFDSEDYDFLSNPDEVMEKISGGHYTSQRNTLNAVIILLMALNSEDKYDKLIETYGKKRDSLNKKYDEDQQSGKISDKQKANFVELSEIKGMINQMEDEIKKGNLKKKETLTGREKQLFMVWLLYNFLMRIPTRNDMAGQRIISKTMYNKLSEDDKKAGNFIVKEKGKMTGIYNEYKTQKKYGERKIDIPKDLEKMINLYVRKTKLKMGDVLFTTSTGTPLSRNQISQLLLKTSKKYLGKNISTTMMRKIVASHHFGEGSEFAELKKKQEDLAEKMGHSVDVMDKVYIKEEQD